MKILEVVSQINGGKVYYYPCNALAHEICSLMKRKTLIQNDIPKLKNLGFEVLIKNEVQK